MFPWIPILSTPGQNWSIAEMSQLPHTTMHGQSSKFRTAIKNFFTESLLIIPEEQRVLERMENSIPELSLLVEITQLFFHSLDPSTAHTDPQLSSISIHIWTPGNLKSLVEQPPNRQKLIMEH